MTYDDRFCPILGPRPGGRPETLDVNGWWKATCDIRPDARIVDLQRVGLKNVERIGKSAHKIHWDNDVRRMARKTVPADFGGVLLVGK